jgi:ABC-type nitrate/sulfonate/bicarbonate transport system substrate-binding protein
MWSRGPVARQAALLLLSLALVAACAPAASPAPKPAAPPAAPPAAAPAAPAPASAQAAPPAAPAAPAKPAQLDVVTVGIPRKSFGYLAMYVADSKGYFRDAGIELRPLDMQCNLIIAAQQRGDIMISGCGTSALRAAAENNLPIKAIFYSYNKATFVFVGHPSIRSVQDLRGKNVGISGFGAETHEIARRLLTRNGLESERDYAFLVVGAGAQMFAALQSGAIHAGMLNTDEAAKLVPDGFPVLATADEVGELLPIPFSGFTVLEDTLRKDAAVLKRWMRAYVRALVLIRDQPAEAARIAVAELAMEPDEARNAVDLTIPAIARDRPGYASEEGMRTLLEYALGDAAHGKSPAQFFDFSLLDEVYRQGF